MSITKKKLKNGGTSYRVNVNRGIINGKRKSALATAKTLQEAKLLEARLTLQVASGEYHDKNDLPPVETFNDLFNQWWPIYDSTVEGSTAYKVKQLFDNHILKIFGDKKLTAITTGSIQSAVMKWRKSTTAAYKQRFIYMKMALKFAVDMEYIEKNPADKVKLPHGVSEKKPEYWNREQCDRFLACIDPVNDQEKYTIFRLMIDTGIRREELCGLNVSDVNFAKSELSITKALATGRKGVAMKETKTRASIRQIPIIPSDLDMLRRWLAVRESGKVVSMKDDRPLFFAPAHPNRRIGINTPNTWLRQIVKANKLTPAITLHGLRHSFITNSLRSGMDVSTVQRLAGHSSPDITLRVYAGLDQSDAQDGIAKLAKYMNR